MNRTVKAFAAAALSARVIGGLPLHPAAAQEIFPAPQRVKVGTLNCDISAGIGLIIASQKQVTCMFTPSEPLPREVYYGSINKFGLDIGATAGGEMAWAVYAPTTRSVGALAGHYGGASAEATVGLGAGANVLIGGSNRTVTLQPVSVQGQAGLNLAVGVASLDLHRAR
ncbi:MAG TPA: DUF992 domain-containing protein [Steroidobacteraceae bacterium]|nr:DUF992 domain-containing protein [Steroidobacteraceae bacterium]